MASQSLTDTAAGVTGKQRHHWAENVNVSVSGNSRQRCSTVIENEGQKRSPHEFRIEHKGETLSSKIPIRLQTVCIGEEKVCGGL